MIRSSEINTFYNLYNSFITVVNDFIKKVSSATNYFSITDNLDYSYRDKYKDIISLYNTLLDKYHIYLNNSINNLEDYILLDNNISKIIQGLTEAINIVKSLYTKIEEINSNINILSKSLTSKSYLNIVFGEGDSLEAIAYRFNITPDEIIVLNKLDYPYVTKNYIENLNTLYPGKEFKLPITNANLSAILTIMDRVKGGVDIAMDLDDNKIKYYLFNNQTNFIINTIIVNDYDNFIQSINRRLNTFIGDWIDNFGIPNILDIVQNSQGMAKIILANSILRDDRIKRINKIDFTYDNKQIKIDLDLEVKELK